MIAFYFILYLVLCILIGMVGKRLPLGFIGLFLISFFLTPIVGILLVIVLAVASSKSNPNPR